MAIFNAECIDRGYLTPTGVTAITSDFGTFFYHAQLTSPMQLSIATDATRNSALFMPLEDGRARVDLTAPLPAVVSGEGIVVVSGITTKKTDAPFTLSFAAPPAVSGPSEAKDGAGCAVSTRGSGWLGTVAEVTAIIGLIVMRRRRPATPRRC